MKSFIPESVPYAEGKVYLYNLTPTLILIYEKDGRVQRVYIGRT